MRATAGTSGREAARTGTNESPKATLSDVSVMVAWRSVNFARPLTEYNPARGRSYRLEVFLR